MIEGNNRLLSGLVKLFSFSNLLLIPKKPAAFIELKGLDVLEETIREADNQVKINYYGMLCYWILSYEPRFVEYSATPSV